VRLSLLEVSIPEASTNSSNLLVSFPSLFQKRLLNFSSRVSCSHKVGISSIELIIFLAVSVSSHSSGNNSFI